MESFYGFLLKATDSITLVTHIPFCVRKKSDKSNQKEDLCEDVYRVSTNVDKLNLAALL